MNVNELYIKNLRNHINSEYKFEEGINFIYGNNGVGKTTILEAISICSISHSFVHCSDMMLVNKNASEYHISSNYTNELGIKSKISISYTNKTQKNIILNSGEKVLPKDIIGEIPTVVLSPDHKRITNAAPEYRRQFLNTVLSQSNKFYMSKLYELRKSLKNRNIILQKLNIREEKFFLDLLYEWSIFYFDVCADIIIRRYEFLKEFVPLFIEAYKVISDSKENVNIIYQPSGITNDIVSKDQIKEALLQKFSKIENNEIQRGMTLFGPQKDDIKILINDGIAREFASQGQHKSLLIALKFAEFKYLLEHKNNIPIILFDDIFSELDSDRVLKVIKLLSESKAQIFITSTNKKNVENEINLVNKFIEIK